MAFDIEKHEENKLRFLEAFYTIVQEHMESDPESGDPIYIGELEAEIGNRAGLSRQQARRVNGDLVS
jgi:hypothetical protein